MDYDKSEENLDRLLQVGGGFGSSTSSWRRTSQHLSNGSILADYSDFINNAIPLPNGHQHLMAPQSW
jgi:hypothetical protein